jgi:NADPH-dependent 2,4-dienoyl-CoA reductase/sulfur reductase-like enzyme
LSKQVLGRSWDPERSRLRVNDLDARLLMGRAATRLDTDSQTVLLDNGSILPYDGLVIATGAYPRRLSPALDQPELCYLRTMDDALALQQRLTGNARVVIIGAGVLGCEIAATCRQLGHEVAIVDQQSLPMIRVVGESLGEWVANLHESHGVRLLCDRRVAGIRHSSNVFTVELDGGESLEAEVVVVAIGAEPTTSWLRGSGVELADGVLCDEEGFALGGRRRIVAAGDVARWVHPAYDQELRVEHWTNAVAQAQLATLNLVTELTGSGTTTPHDALPYSWSDQYDRKIQILGLP